MRPALLLTPTLAALLTACSPQENPRDAAFRQSLAGTWTFGYTTESGSPVAVDVALNPDGRFNRLDHASDGDTQYAGPWHVTEGQLKLHYQIKNGKPMSGGRMVYFTCRITDVEAHRFRCVNDVAQYSIVFVKGAAGTRPA